LREAMRRSIVRNEYCHAERIPAQPAHQ